MNHAKLSLLLFLASASIGVATATASEDDPSWIRQTALSPDGKEIAFTYRGDIFVVSRDGGRARQITSNPAYDKSPVWSPDGSKIAFASDRDGAFNVYVTGREGGSAKRITYVNSRSQTPVAFLDETHVLYDQNLRPTTDMGIFPYGTFSQLYSQSVDGGRPELFSPTAMKMPSIAPDGRILYTDIKGYEDEFRKHQVSPIARDIWLWTPGGKYGSYKKLTDFKGEDRNAIWLPDGKSYLFTSERDGTFNVYRASIDGGAPTQLTRFTKHPVRYMSGDRAGNVAFSMDGNLYYMPLGGEARKVDVRIVADYTENPVKKVTLTRGLTNGVISPDGKEMIFVVHGDVYATSVEYDTTRRITDTPGQERVVSVSPDGRKIVYDSERDGKWNLYMAEIVREKDKLFTYATEIKETKLTDDDAPSQQPLISPDGKKVAFLRDRTGLFVLDLETKKETEVMNKKYQYSYQDGDQYFQWAPDSRWLLTNYIGIGGWNNPDVALVSVETPGKIVDLTQSGYGEGSGKFVLGGKAIAFYSDRNGYRSHGSWGSEGDIMLMFLDKEAFDRYRRTKEERELGKSEDEDKKEPDSKKGDKKSKGKKDTKSEDKKDAVTPLKFDLDGAREYRTVRVSRTSGTYSDFVMDDKGEKLYYIAYFDDSANLYEYNLIEKSTTMLIPEVGFGSLQIDKDGKTLYFFGRDGAKKIEGKKVTPISFKARSEEGDPAERAYIFDHVVSQVAEKFYDPDLHGVDWAGYAQSYRSKLGNISNNYDFAELLSELLGELNASHTGARYGGSDVSNPTGSLGLFYDDTYKGEGVKIKEVMCTGPMYKASSAAKPGAVVLKINGETIAPDKPIEYYLNGLAGERVLVTLKGTDGKISEEEVRTIHIGSESSLLYKRWVKQRQDLVEKQSKGRIGYVHIQGMDSRSYRTIFADVLGKYRNCDAIVVDTRFNGGGWLHNDVALLFSGKEYARFTPRGQYIGSEPFMQWYKPSVMLVSEGNYSDAYGTPWTYKTLKVGKLVGTPVAGTMTAVWWETQVDPTLVFGIPQVTVEDMQGHALENHLLEPDILVYNTPEQNLSGEDEQLRTAVDELLRQTAK